MAFTEKKKLLELSPDKIVPNPAQPRLDFPQDKLLQLAESIRQNGVLQPILVRRDRDRYILVAGERRWRASRMAGIKTIPAIVQELSPQDGAVLALIENMQRSDLNFFEEAAAIYALMQDRAMTQEETARRLGMSQPSAWQTRSVCCGFPAKSSAWCWKTSLQSVMHVLCLEWKIRQSAWQR